MTNHKPTKRAEIARNTLVRVENERNVTTDTMDAIQRAFEAGGIEFLSNDGLRLKRRLRAETWREQHVEQKDRRQAG